MRNLILICGTTGCGKSTIGQFLADEKGCKFLEGDDYHSPQNKEKMKAKQPLTDEDRKPWLHNLSRTCTKELSMELMVIVTCSALKQEYRKVFRDAVQRRMFDEHVENVCAAGTKEAAAKVERMKVDFIFLYMDQAKALDLVRTRARKIGHYMPEELVESQFRTLEVPSDAESDCHHIDANAGVTEVKTLALRALDGILGLGAPL